MRGCPEAGDRRMNAIRVRKRVDSETLHLPELKDLVGKTVEIIILEETPAAASAPRDLSWFMALAPKRQPPTPQEMEQLRAAAQHDKALAAALDIAERGGIDADAIAEIRAASMI